MVLPNTLALGFSSAMLSLLRGSRHQVIQHGQLSCILHPYLQSSRLIPRHKHLISSKDTYRELVTCHSLPQQQGERWVLHRSTLNPSSCCRLGLSTR